MRLHLSATQIDPRIKAVVTTSMYDMSRVIRKGWLDSTTDEQRKKALKQLSEQRYLDFENKKLVMTTSIAKEDIEKITNPILREFAEYYKTSRGEHPRSFPSFSITSVILFMNFSLLSHLNDIAPRPVLLIIGGKCSFSLFYWRRIQGNKWR